MNTKEVAELKAIYNHLETVITNQEYNESFSPSELDDLKTQKADIDRALSMLANVEPASLDDVSPYLESSHTLNEKLISLSQKERKQANNFLKKHKELAQERQIDVDTLNALVDQYRTSLKISLLLRLASLDTEFDD